MCNQVQKQRTGLACSTIAQGAAASGCQIPTACRMGSQDMAYEEDTKPSAILEEKALEERRVKGALSAEGRRR